MILFRPNNNICVFLVQIRFQGVTNCVDWILIDHSAKIAEANENLASVIQQSCNCQYTISAFQKAKFYCFNESPNYVTYRALIVAQSNVTEAYIVGEINKWLSSKPSLSIIGEVLQVDTDCPIVILEINEPECASYVQNSNFVLIGGLLSSTALALLMLVSIIIMCIVILKR